MDEGRCDKARVAGAADGAGAGADADRHGADRHGADAGLLGAPSLADLERWRVALGEVAHDLTDTDRIDRLRALEELKGAACAAQAALATDFARSQRAEQAAAGVPAERRGRGVAAQVALARRESPARGGYLLGLAQSLVDEMPRTYAALRRGLLNEWRATLLVRESACLSRDDRHAFDAEVAADLASLEGVGDRQLVARAKQIAYRLDAASVVRRARRAEGERRVSLRPAPDTMSYLTGLLPVAQGVSVLATLAEAADAGRAAGDPRSRGQIMADTLVERVTGQLRAEDVAVEVQIVMTDRSLLDGADDPATIPGHGPVPAGWARRLLAGLATADGPTRLWSRRLFTAPMTGQLVAMDSRRRTVPPGLARFIDIRDQTCSTPWCDASIRHHDHVVPASDGGPTAAHNLKGTCEACNYAKQAPGWHERAGPADGPRLVTTRTPTGHEYRSVAPALPGHRRQRAGPEGEHALGEHAKGERAGGEHAVATSAVDRWMVDLVWAA